jgi:hypothetical protein
MTLNELLQSDGALRDAMKEKNSAILEAQTLKSRGDLPGAIRQYRRAGELEYQIFRHLEDSGLPDAALINLISAASCWYEAEELLAARKAVHEAIERCSLKDPLGRDCEELLAKIERDLVFSRRAEESAQPSEPVKV